MNIVIAGAGTIGRHVAEVLVTAGHNITVIELDPARLRALENELDIRTLHGNCAHAEVLREAGVDRCDMFVAATNHDEVNLFSASTAKGVGAKRCVARVHHGAYFDNRGLNYQQYFKVDSLICPEYATAVAIARTLRNPGALAVENFARGSIEMQQLKVSDDAPAVGIRLAKLDLPGGVRIATVTSGKTSLIPQAGTVICAGDIVTLIGEKHGFDMVRKLLQTEKIKRKHVVIMGGTSMGVWLCRALRPRHFAVRLFVADHDRAEELAAKLEHVTVIEAEATEPVVAAEENIADTDVFISLTDDDEDNILAAAQAKSMGAKTAITVTQRSTYQHLLKHVGIDRAFNPRVVAAREIQFLLEPGPIRVLASLVEATADVYEIQVGVGASLDGQPLRKVKFSAPCVVGAIQRKDKIYTPGPDDTIQAGDIVLVIGPRGMEKQLKKLFVGKAKR